MIQENRHNIEPGERFTIRNRHGYEWSAKIIRVTDKSVISRSIPYGAEHRESLNTWNGYIEHGFVSRCDCQFPNEDSETRLISETCHEHNYSPKPVEDFV